MNTLSHPQRHRESTGTIANPPNKPALGPAASIVISTRNRKDELRRAVESALTQQPRVEIIVLDDGSTDGTAEMIASDFPEVILHRTEVSTGYIVQRNRGARLATAPIVISMDDDAVFASSDTVRQTIEDFDDPRVGAVAIPFIDVGRSESVRQQSPNKEGIFARNNFRGTAGAVRRDIFLKLGGYREYFLHQGEEDEFCIRLLQAGYITRPGRADPLLHFESPKRDRNRIYLHQARNNLLFAWYNVPALWLLPHLLATAVNCLRAGIAAGYGGASLRGCWRGLVGIWHERDQRSAVSPATYHLLRRLKKSGPLRLGEIQQGLPASELRSAAAA
jgi:glycosyltransferase involved in cell wall biosynthesis